MPRIRLVLLALALPLLLAAPAAADTFTKVPPLDGTAEPLRIRFVRYDGSTNGQMVVEVENTSKKRATFRAEGIYFVPEGDPASAPQRLGAAGPIVELVDRKDQVRLEGVALAPGQKKELRLEVFCIDSHRASPNPKTRFSIAAERLPKKLRQQIVTGTRKAISDSKGDVAKAKSAIQSHTWATRDADWVELEGERKGEAELKKQQREQRQRPVEQRQRRPAPQQR